MTNITKIIQNAPGIICSALGLLFVGLGVICALWSGSFAGYIGTAIISGIGLIMGGFLIAPSNHNQITQLLIDSKQDTCWMTTKESIGVGVVSIGLGLVCWLV